MSFYAALAGLICIGIGSTSHGIATFIVYIKSRQQEDKTDKTNLLVASIFLALSMLFVVLTIIFGFIMLSAKSCTKKRTRIIFLIVLIMLVICLIIAIVILRIYVSRKTKAGDTGSARDLQASWVMPLVALPFYLIGFILLYFVIGKKFSKLNKVCKQASRVTGKA